MQIRAKVFFETNKTVVLGEKLDKWLVENKITELVKVIQTESASNGDHFVTMTVFYKEPLNTETIRLDSLSV